MKRFQIALFLAVRWARYSVSVAVAFFRIRLLNAFRIWAEALKIETSKQCAALLFHFLVCFHLLIHIFCYSVTDFWLGQNH